MPNNISWTVFLYYVFIYFIISVAVETIFGCIILNHAFEGEHLGRFQFSILYNTLMNILMHIF